LNSLRQGFGVNKERGSHLYFLTFARAERFRSSECA
jgi:hypothetical protein